MTALKLATNVLGLGSCGFHNGKKIEPILYIHEILCVPSQTLHFTKGKLACGSQVNWIVFVSEQRHQIGVGIRLDSGVGKLL